MTRIVYDQFGKQYLAELLASRGHVETDREVGGEVQHVDLWFVPEPSKAQAAPSLGLLSRMVDRPCLLEPYRNVPGRREVRECLRKLFVLHGDWQRQARREKRRVPESGLPMLWILMPSASGALLSDFGVGLEPDMEDWPAGVYRLSRGWRTGLVAVDELPETEETLWLRVLGRGETQARAVREMLALAHDHPLRKPMVTQLARWRILLKNRPRLSRDDREVLMNLDFDYDTWEAKAEQRGILADRRDIATRLLTHRFGAMDASLSRAIDSIIGLDGDQFLDALLNLSREELIERFGHE